MKVELHFKGFAEIEVDSDNLSLKEHEQLVMEFLFLLHEKSIPNGKITNVSLDYGNTKVIK
jgi:hypothetical protein